jgi:Protein of unknown function (DUF3810)
VPPARQRSPLLRTILILIPAALAGVVFLILKTASPETIERVYSRGLYPVIARIIGWWSDLVPFSVAEVLFVALVAAILFLAVRGTVRLVRRRSTVRSAAWFVARLVVIGAPVAYMLFVGLWGANYGRRPIEEKIGFSRERITPERFHQSLLRLAMWTDGNREASAGHDPRDLPTTEVILIVRDLDGVSIPYARREKTLILNDFFRICGIHGITSPFTHETHYRSDLFPFEIPFVAAHERAHLAGYASEAEASFVAYQACVRSSSAMARYSGHLSMLRLFLGAASSEARTLVGERISEGVREDLRAIAKRNREESSPLREISTRLNDAYLKANRVAAGVGDYGRVVKLVLGADRRSWVLP